MNKIKLFEGFSGYGSQKLAFKRLGIEVESVGISEIDPDAIIAYAALHCDESKYIDEGLSIETKRQILIDCNVGYDFQKNKSSIPRMKKEKLEKLYKSHILSKNQGDISLIEGENLPDMDFLTYSFPCQDISVAGKGMGLSKDSGTRSSLLWECLKIIAAKRPKYLMMENVKNLVGKKNLPDFQSWINELRELGYNNYYKVINAKDCGVPQNRERVFCVSIRRDADEGTFRFNEPFDNGVRLKDLLEDEVEEKFYIADEKVEKLLEQLKEKNQEISYCVDANYYKGTTPEQFLEKSRRQLVAVPCLTPDRIEKRQNGRRFKEDGEPMLTLTGQDRHGVLVEEDNNIKVVGNTVPSGHTAGRVVDVKGISPTVMYRNSKVVQILEKQISAALNECILLGRAEGISGHDYCKRVYSKEGICPTLNANGGGNLEPKTYTGYRIRKLTPKECFRLMGLTDEEIQKIQDAGISNSQQYKMAGNSIVVDQMFFLKNLFL